MGQEGYLKTAGSRRELDMDDDIFKVLRKRNMIFEKKNKVMIRWAGSAE